MQVAESNSGSARIFYGWYVVMACVGRHSHGLGRSSYISVLARSRPYCTMSLAGVLHQ